jgi:hypothetical protein
MKSIITPVFAIVIAGCVMLDICTVVHRHRQSKACEAQGGQATVPLYGWRYDVVCAFPKSQN